MSAVPVDSFLSSGFGGRYYPIARVGRGGMSEVYLTVARGPAGFNKLVVIKRLLPSLVADTQFLEMFLDEARLAAQLNHPNVVQTNEVGVTGGTYFIAMEYLEGQPLLKLMQRSAPEPLPVNVALGIAANVSAGLHYAHTLTNFSGAALGIVHRDVSPQNIFVTYTGQVKIVDFGIAKAAGQTTETATGILKGKIAYMSPEQVCSGPLDGRADIFSLGVVLYEALTGKRMWGAPTRDVDVLKRLLSGDVPSSPRLIIPAIAEDVDRICQRALAVEREHRYESALEMHKDIQACIARLPHPISEREIGEMVARMFEQERQTIAKVIEKRLSLMGESEELAARSVPSFSRPSGAMSLTPAKESNAAALEQSTWPWGALTAHGRRTFFVLAALFGVIGTVAMWSASRGPDRTSGPDGLPRAAAVQAPAPVAMPVPSATDAPQTNASSDAATMRTSVAPAPAAPPRRAPAPAPAPPRPSASAEAPAPSPPHPVITTPTYGPLDDRH
jgi:serine/threonine-protein kinase